ncbi:MAG: hypothetical protein AYK23_03500 [Candidatus Proteinoplasmatales archaeon SG8-5]|nr:MAG: hypothetical protein AYK23_03500 [Candidatus Proteinoplasmatales archaeon SG8-5]
MVAKDAAMCYACGAKIGEEGEAIEEEAPDEEEAPAEEEEKEEEEAPAEGGEDEIPCPECGTMISNDAVMCYACGAKIESKEEGGEEIEVKKVAKKRVV